MSHPSNKRRFSRVQFNAASSLAQGRDERDVELLDISLKGVTIAPFDIAGYDMQSPLQLKVTLTENAVIDMNLLCVHQQNHGFGFKCIDIDADSMGHLRRLIELNLGDAAAAERELVELFSDSPNQ